MRLSIESPDSHPLPEMLPQNWVRLSREAFQIQVPFELDAQLNWPQGTVGLLNYAFKANLSRFDSWDLSALNQAQKKAAVHAAKFYKRGVLTSEDPPNHLNQKPPSYDISIYDKKAEPWSQLAGSSSWIIYDQALREYFPFFSRLNPLQSLAIRCLEKDKTLSAIIYILQSFKFSRAPRHWNIIGGGLLCDLSAFAASQLEGVSFSFYPTTLLAMIDASIGSKAGINWPPYGKNQVGSFSSPHEVHLFPHFLRSLEPRHKLSGLAEVFKHLLLSGTAEELCSSTAQDFGESWNSELVIRNLKVKAQYVALDPYDLGPRSLLNLGHTMGHALEAYAHQFDRDSPSFLYHGEAVALGLFYMSLLSEQHAGLSRHEGQLIRNGLKRWGLIRRPGWLFNGLRIWQEIYRLLCQDKKNHRGPRFVLLKALGQAYLPDGSYSLAIKEEELLDTFASFIGLLGSSQTGSLEPGHELS